MIYDLFQFFDELDLLECRLRELEDIPLKHVLAEAPVTHTGIPKPFWYAENKERFSAWEDKIIHVMLTEDDASQVTGIPSLSGRQEISVQRAVTHRRCLSRGIENAEPDDLILLSDVDEIPRREVFSEPVPGGLALEMSFHNFAVDWLHPLPWCGTVTSLAKDITDLEDLRNMRNLFPRIRHAGWHFSWLGGPEGIKRKAAATSHDDTAARMIEWADAGLLYQGGRTWVDGKPFGLTAQMKPTGTDDLPLWIREHKCPRSWFRPQPKLAWNK